MWLEVAVLPIAMAVGKSNQYEPARKLIINTVYILMAKSR